MFGLLTDEANIELDHIQQLTTLNCDVCSNSGALEGVQSFTHLYTENFWQEVFTKITMPQFLNFMMILQKHRRIPHGVDKNLMFSELYEDRGHLIASFLCRYYPLECSINYDPKTDYRQSVAPKERKKNSVQSRADIDCRLKRLFILDNQTRS